MIRVKISRLFELARPFVRLDHVAGFIVNANHGEQRGYYFTLSRP
jgi:hypothetical protein